MANVSTTLVIKAKNETNQGINEAKSSFQQFTSSIDSITGGLGGKISNLLANPWTGVAVAIGATVKVTKELWSAGLDAQTGFEQLQQAFGSYAEEVDGMLDAIDRTTLATKEDLESMAKRISQYGLSTEQLQSVLQTTADIATKTGQSFGTVESAVVSAMNGQDKALNKLVPEWKDYKEGAEDAATAIANLGDSIHDSTIQIQSGSIAQTLDNMSSSWQNIKENLGQTLVTRIETSGVLERIENFLQKIEEHTGSRAARAAAQPEIDLLNKYKSTSEYSMLLEAGLVSPETVQLLLSQSDVALATHTNYGLLTKTQYGMYQTALNQYLEAHPVVETPAASGTGIGVVSTPTTTAATDSWLSKYETFMSVGKTHWVSGVGLQTDMSWMARIMSGDWTGVTDSDWDDYYDLLLKCPEDQKWAGMMETYQKDRLAYELWKNAPTETPSVQLNIGKSAWGEGSKPYEAITIGTRTYDWRLGGLVSEQSRKTAEILLSEAPDWDSITEEDWAELAETISMFPEGPTRTQAEEIYRQKRNVYETYYWLKDNPRPSTGSTAPSVTLNWGYEDLANNPDYQWDPVLGRYANNPDYQWDPVLGRYKRTAESLTRDWTAQGIVGYREQLAYEAQFTSGKTPTEAIEEQTDEEKKSFEDIAKDVEKGFNTVTSAVNALKAWGDGQYQQGEVGSGIGAVGSVVSLFAPRVGAVLSAVGAGVGLLEALFGGGEETELSGTTDADYQTSLATYNGGLNLTINNIFEGANIVGAGGMEELAMTVQKQIEHWAYDNR